MSPAFKKLVLWVLLIMMFVAIWQFLSPDPASTAHHARTAAASGEEGGAWTRAVVLVGSVAALIVGFRAFMRSVEAHNAAIRASNAHFLAGRMDEALRALDGLRRSRITGLRRAIHVQRAAISLARCDAEAALASIAAAEAEPLGWLFRDTQRTQLLNVRGMRAFLRAAAGDEAGAREDLAALRAAPDPQPIVLARAALAEARVLEGKGDRKGLAELLDQSRSLFRNVLPRRELALVRAYQAMVEASPGSVYRQKGDRVEAGDEGGLVVAWVAHFAPGAAPFVRVGSLPAGAPGEARAEAPSDEAVRKVEGSRPKKARNVDATKTLVLWVALMGLGLGLFTKLSGADGGGIELTIALAAGFVGLLLWVGRSLRNSRREGRRIDAAARAIGAGDLDRAAAELAFEPAAALRRAQAAHLRAEVEMLRGHADRALAECDRAFLGLAQVGNGTAARPAPAAAGKSVDWDLTRLVVAQRAIALAALGRGDEAWAEIAWAQGFPSALPVFTVLLVTRLHARDYEGAARTVEARDPALPLSAYHETLAELARFMGRPAARTAPDTTRLRAELRRDRELRGWVKAMAPGLTAAFERVAGEGPSASPEATAL